MEDKNDIEHLINERLLKEYEMAQQMAVHYDQMNWQIGSILIAGIFVAIGIIGTKIEAYLLLGVISFLILLAWNRFYFRHKSIQDLKFQRLHEIEEKLNLRQHLAIKEADKNASMKGIHSKSVVGLITYGLPALLLVIYFIDKLWN